MYCSRIALEGGCQSGTRTSEGAGKVDIPVLFLAGCVENVEECDLVVNDALFAIRVCPKYVRQQIGKAEDDYLL